MEKGRMSRDPFVGRVAYFLSILQLYANRERTNSPSNVVRDWQVSQEAADLPLLPRKLPINDNFPAEGSSSGTIHYPDPENGYIIAWSLMITTILA